MIKAAGVIVTKDVPLDHAVASGQKQSGYAEEAVLQRDAEQRMRGGNAVAGGADHRRGSHNIIGGPEPLRIARRGRSKDEMALQQLSVAVEITYINFTPGLAA